MLLSNIINDSFGLLSKQLRFYCWHFRRDLDQRQRQELIDLLCEQHFERLATRIRALNQSPLADCQQQIGKLLFEHCLSRNKRHQLIQLIESKLVDIDVRLDNYGRTLLHRCSCDLDVELVKILIDRGVNIRLRDYAGNTALHMAIQSYRNGAVIYGNESQVLENLTAIISLLLEADKNLLNERSKRKRLKVAAPDDNQEQLPISTKRVTLDHSFAHTQSNFLISNQRIRHPYYNFNDDRPSVGPVIRSNRFHIDLYESNIGANLVADKQHNTQTAQRPSTDSSRNINQSEELQEQTLNPILLEDTSSPLVDTKNAFGRTALHYCVLVVGEKHLGHFVKLLLDFGAESDVTDTRMRTPLHCLVKRPGISAIRQKCSAIEHLLRTGCDDLGLAIDTDKFFTEEIIAKLEQQPNVSAQNRSEAHSEPIFCGNTFKRVPSLKHLTRLNLIRNNIECIRYKKQIRIRLPSTAPKTLDGYINRKILDQSELF